MKRVSFEVAKALKEAGYPQDYKNAEDTYTNLNGGIWVKPTYMEVWLWLWRKKKIIIELEWGIISDSEACSYCYCNETKIEADDPEEAIEKAIECLCENDLIK